MKCGDTIGLIAKGVFMSGAYGVEDDENSVSYKANVAFDDFADIDNLPLTLEDLEAAIPEYDRRKIITTNCSQKR